MTKIKACDACGVAIELNIVDNKDIIKASLPVDTCPLCGGKLIDDDSENYEV